MASDNVPQVIQTYYGDWKLGLTVREEHGGHGSDHEDRQLMAIHDEIALCAFLCARPSSCHLR